MLKTFAKFLLFGASLTLLSACSFQQPFEPLTDSIATVTGVTGIPSVLRNSRPYLVAAQSRLFPGDVIETDALSRVDLHLNSNVHVKLAPNTQLHFIDARTNGTGYQYDLSLSKGVVELLDLKQTSNDLAIRTSIAKITTIAEHIWIAYTAGESSLYVVSLGSREVSINNRHGEVVLTRPYQGVTIPTGIAPQDITQWSQNKFKALQTSYNQIPE
jgi:hypothetical protein